MMQGKQMMQNGGGAMPQGGGMQDKYAATQKYTSAADMPELNMPKEGEDKTENPVIGALRTLTIFSKALEEKQDPNAAAIKEPLINLMKAFAQVAGGAGAGPAAPGQGQGKDNGMAFNPFEEAAAEPQQKKKMQRQNEGNNTVPLV